MNINYECVWNEDDAAHRMPGHVTPAKKYEELSGEILDRTEALQRIDRGDWIGFVFSTGYIVAEAAGGCGGVYKLPDVLTQPEMAEMVEALGGEEFFFGGVKQNCSNPVLGSSQATLWHGLGVRRFARKSPFQLMTCPGKFIFCVTGKGKDELRRAYASGRLTF